LPRDAADTSLRDTFRTWFEVVPACTPALRDAAFRVRHSVYCEDLGYEARRADGRETDEYDEQSLHLLVHHRPSAQFVGCVRLIRVSQRDAAQQLPFERVSRGLAPGVVPGAPERRVRIAEVSRLAIVRAFRRRRGEAARPAPLSSADYSGGPVVRFPHILTGLYLGVVATATMHGISTLFVLTEPRLADHLHKLGLRILQIGPPVEHRGMRVPSMIDVDPLAHGLGPMMRPLYEHIFESIRLSQAQAARMTPGSARVHEDGR
jgi:N-acyl amino acid synthase of PEP-CTERM/exosortase system